MDRPRAGKKHKKRVPLLIHPKIKAFKGWRSEPEPWSYGTVKKYVDWCHISKLFPLYRHGKHVKTNKVNLAYCKNIAFMRRCCEVWFVLYLEERTFRNDDFCFFLAQMVYTEVILKKEVDWTTLKELPVGIRPEKAKLVGIELPHNWQMMLRPVKIGKSFVPDEEVVWSAASSDDEHTHEYDGYSFLSEESEHEDISMEDFWKAFYGETDEKGKGVEDPMIIEEEESDGTSGSEDDEDILLAKVRSATLTLEAKKEELKILKEGEANRGYGDDLKLKLKTINKAIANNDEDFDAFKTNRDTYLKKCRSGKASIMDEYLLWESKLETLRRRRQVVEQQRRALNGQIHEKEKEYHDKAVQHASEVDLEAEVPTYGEKDGEIETLRELVKFHEKQLAIMKDEERKLAAECRYYRAWTKWAFHTFGEEHKDDEEEKQPQPRMSDFNIS